MTPPHESPPPSRSPGPTSKRRTGDWPPSRNQLLGALPPLDLARIAEELELVDPGVRTVVQKPGEPVGHVYFPCGGFLSVLMVLADGEAVEVATVGREGSTGATSNPEGEPPASMTIVQAQMGTCYRMPADAFLTEMNRLGPFHEVITLYGQRMINAVMQLAACNAVHSVEQRLARWLLTAHDRVGADDFPLTQEFVSMMLGAARQTVTVVAGTLQRAGLITYRHGRVRILDREALEQASCECYGAAARLFEPPDSSGKDPIARFPRRT
jgi:CRP-like cAMP-binding protein